MRLTGELIMFDSLFIYYHYICDVYLPRYCLCIMFNIFSY